MEKVKKNICLMMVSLFTMFITFGTIPAGAITKSTAAKKQVVLATVYVTQAESIVKTASFSVDLARTSVKLADAQVKKIYAYGKAYYASYNSLKKRLTTVTVKINIKARALADAKAAAEAVLNAERFSNTSIYDLMNDNVALINAKMAVSTAIAAINKLNMTSMNYKNYTARINVVNARIAKVESDKEEALLVNTAENAVRAVETAPLASYNDITKIYELQNSAVTAIAKVRDINVAANFTARLKVATDRAATLKAQLDAAIIEAGTPAKVISASAVDGRITVTFNKKPITIVSPADFKLTKSINGTITNVIISGITIVNDTTAVLSVPYISSEPYAELAIFYSIQYSGGNPINTNTVVVPKLPVPYVLSVSAADNKTILVAYSEAMDDNAYDKRNYIIRDKYWNAVGTIASISKVSGQGNVYKLRLASGLRGGVYTVIISNVVSQNGVSITESSKQITIIENIPALGVSAKTVVAVLGKAPKGGTQNIQKVTINGSFTSVPEKQVLSINNPNNPGQQEVNALTINGEAAVNTGAFLVTFADGVINTGVNVPVAIGDNASIIGSLIRLALISIPAVNNAFSISDSNGTVTITARTAAADKNVSIMVYPVSGLNPGGNLSFKQTQIQAGSATGLTASGNIVLRVNNPVGSLIRTVTVPIAAGLNNVNVAAQITAELKKYGDITNQYSITASGNTVVIQDKILNQGVAQAALAIIDAGTTFLAYASSIETQAPTSGHGTLLAYLNGTCVTIYLAPTDTTAALVAARIAMALNSDPIVGLAYTSVSNGQVITITRRVIGYTSSSITLVNGTAKIPPSKIVIVQPGSEVTAGVNQINTVTIISSPIINGILTITINDGAIKQTVKAEVNAGDSLSVVAQKIFGQLIYDTVITNSYNISITDSKITFVKKVPAAAQSFGFAIQ